MTDEIIENENSEVSDVIVVEEQFTDVPQEVINQSLSEIKVEVTEEDKKKYNATVPIPEKKNLEDNQKQKLIFQLQQK